MRGVTSHFFLLILLARNCDIRIPNPVSSLSIVVFPCFKTPVASTALPLQTP